MNAREQGRRAARSLTTALALSGVALVGGLGVAAYTSIEAAKTATARTGGTQAPATNPPTLSREHDQEGDDGAGAQQAQQAPSAGSDSSGASSSSSGSSSGSGVSGGSGPSSTSSTGS